MKIFDPLTPLNAASCAGVKFRITITFETTGFLADLGKYCIDSAITTPIATQYRSDLSENIDKSIFDLIKGVKMKV